MPARSARTTWTGDLMSGQGHVDLLSSNVASFDVTFPRRTADTAEGTTSPEELLAAAHSSCFAMEFSHQLKEAGGTPKTLDVRSEVTVEVGAGGLDIRTSHLTVRAEVDGIDQADFAAAAEKARAGCPVSKALGTVTITLDASLS